MKFRTDFSTTVYLRDSCRKPKYCSNYILPAVTEHSEDWQSHLICSHKSWGSTDWRRAHHVKTLHYLRRCRQPWQCVKMPPPPPLNSGIIHFNLNKYILVPQCFALCPATCLPRHHAIKRCFLRTAITGFFSGPCQRSTTPSFSSSAGSVPRQRAVVRAGVSDVVNSYMNTTSQPSCWRRLMKGLLSLCAICGAVLQELTS